MATVNLESFPEPENAECPKCNGSLVFLDPQGSEFIACPSCNAFLQFEPKSAKATVCKTMPPVKLRPTIPIGSEGTLKDYKFKVIAYLEKQEKDTHYNWREYLLYNYQKGYATLAEYEGHWNFIVDKAWEPSLEKAFSEDRTATNNDIEYRVFNKYIPETTALMGELDWNVLEDTPNTHEYVAPPYMLFREISGPNANFKQYFLGAYTDPYEIAEAFNLDLETFPTQYGVGANEPSPYADRFQELAKYSVLAALAIIFLNFLVQIVKPERQLINSDYNIVFAQDSLQKAAGIMPFSSSGSYEFKPFRTASFTQPDESALLEIDVESFVSNNWLETTVVLVNDKTNETWEVTKGIEFYYGRENGESWKEGSRNATIMLSAIPKGEYHFNVYPSSGDPFQTLLHIRVSSNVTLWRNILLVILILSLYPIYCAYKMNKFEKRRWMNSDYSPFESH